MSPGFEAVVVMVGQVQMLGFYLVYGHNEPVVQGCNVCSEYVDVGRAVRGSNSLTPAHVYTIPTPYVWGVAAFDLHPAHAARSVDDYIIAIVFSERHVHFPAPFHALRHEQ
jgi:hypothetical protein